MSFFLLLYLLVFPFGQFTRLNLESFGGLARFLGPEVKVYLGDVLAGLAVVVWGAGRVMDLPSLKLRRARGKKGDKGIEGRIISRPILIFAGAAALSLLVNLSRLTAGEVLVSSFYLFRWLVYAGLYFVVSDLTEDGLRLLMLAGGITAVFGLLQYFFFPDLRVWLEAGGWDPHYYRAYGTFFDPGYFGTIMVLTLILVIIGLLAPRKARPFVPNCQLSAISYYILLITCYSALALSYSRSSYLAYLVGMGVIAWKLKKPQFYAKVLLIFAITLLLLPRPGGEGVRLEREASIKARIINWKQSLTIAKDHPLFGVGFNAYRYAQRDYGFLDEEKWQLSHAGAGADSSLLFVLATTGLVGLSTYVWLLKSAFDINRYKSDISGYRLIVLASLLALLVHSLFLNSLFYPWIMGWMWILLGGIIWV